MNKSMLRDTEVDLILK